MPYKSDRQRRFMNAVHPEVAARWNKYQKGGPLPSYQASPATIGSPYDSGYQWDDPVYSASPDQERVDPIEAGHAALDVAGMVPGLGIVPDLINAGWYGAEGDYTGMGLSAAAALPIAGLVATPAKHLNKVIRKVTPKTTKKLTKAEIAELPVLNKAEQAAMKEVIPAKKAPPAKQVEKIGDLIPDINKRLEKTANIKRGKYKNWDLKVETAPNNSKRLITRGKPPGSKTWKRLGFMDFDKIEPSLFSDATRSVGTKFIRDNPGFSRRMDYPTKYAGEEGFGIGGEFTNAINKSLKAQKNVLLSSSKHTKSGLERYLKSLVAGRTRIPPVSNSYDYVMKNIANLDFVPTSYTGIPDNLKTALEHTTFRYLEDGGYLFPMAHGGNISTTGYKEDSPDRFNSYNIIPSNNITMKGVNKPIKATPLDKVGNPITASTIMKPGENYTFPGSSVYEEPLPMYFGGGDVDWGGVASGAASGAGAGTAVLPGWGTAIGAIVGGGAALFGQSQQHKAQAMDEAEAEEAAALQKEQQEEYMAMSQFIAPPSNEPAQPQQGKSWGAQEQPWGQAGGNKPMDYGTAFYKKGGKLPKYQANVMGPPDYSPEQYSRFYSNSLKALKEEEERAATVNRNSLALARRAADPENPRDFLRPLTGADTPASQAFRPLGYTETPKGTKCYGDTCIYSATTLKGEAGSGHRPVTGNWTFRDKAKEYGYEKVSLKDRKPGDIVQYERDGTPVHAVTLGEGDNIYYDPGAYSPKFPYKKGSHQKYLDTYGKARAYRYVGQKKELEEKAEKVRQQMLSNPQEMATLSASLPTTSPNQQLMLPPPQKHPAGPLASYQASDMPIISSPMEQPETLASNFDQWAKEKNKKTKKWFKKNVNTATTTKFLKDMGAKENNAARVARGLKFLKNVYLPKYQINSQQLPVTTDPNAYSPDQVQNQQGGFFGTSDPEFDMDILNYSGDRSNPGVLTAQANIGGGHQYPMPTGQMGNTGYNLPNQLQQTQMHNLMPTGNNLPMVDIAGNNPNNVAPIPPRDPFASVSSEAIDAMREKDSANMLGQFDIQQANRDQWGNYNKQMADASYQQSPQERRQANKAGRQAKRAAKKAEREAQGGGGGGGAAWAQAVPALLGIGASIYGASQLTKNREPAPPATNPYQDLWQSQQMQAANRPQGGGGGMDIPTARSLGFTQSNPSVYAKKGGCLPMYQASKTEVGPGGYGTMGEYNMMTAKERAEWDAFAKSGLSKDIWNARYRGDWKPLGTTGADAMQPGWYPSEEELNSMDLETRKIYESPKERKDQLPKYQAAGTFLREGTWNPRNRTMQQDPNRGGGQEGAYGMNKGALDFGTLPMENIPIPNQNTNPNPFATPNAYNPMLMAQRGGHLPQYQEESNNVPSSRWSNKGVSDYVKNNPEMFTIKPSPFTNTPCDIKTADGECVNTEQVMYPDLFKTETETLEDKKIKELQDLGVDPNMIKQAKQMNLFSKQKGGNIYTQENPHQGATFEAERPEVVKHGAGNHPIALANGGTINNSNNFTKITGNRHSDAEGGVQLAGAEGGFVYSDFIKVPKDLEKQINSLV